MNEIINLIIENDIDRLKSYMSELTYEEKKTLFEEAIDSDGDTVMHLAVREDNLEALKVLLEEGATVDVSNALEESPLSLAKELGFHRLVGYIQLHVNILEILNKLNLDENFDFNEAIKYLEKSLEAAKGGEGKKLNLLIGSSGSGKSTGTNYLNEVKYKLVGRGSLKKKLKFVEGDEIVETGQARTKSKTLFPKVVTIQSQNGDSYSFADLAGWYGTRRTEIELAGNMGTHMLSKSVKNIKSILFFIDIGEMDTGRAVGFKKNMITLAKMLSSGLDYGDYETFEERMKSVIFLITKTEQGTLLEDVFEEIIDPFIVELESEKKLEEYDALFLLMLRYLKENEAQILIPDFADMGQSRELIFNSIDNSVGLDPDALNFLHMDNHQQEFKKIIEAFIGQYHHEELLLRDSYTMRENALNQRKSMIEESLESREQCIEENEKHLKEAQEGNVNREVLKDKNNKKQAALRGTQGELSKKIGSVQSTIDSNSRHYSQELNVSTPSLWDQTFIQHAQEFEEHKLGFWKQAKTLFQKRFSFSPAAGSVSSVYTNAKNLAPGDIVSVNTTLSVKNGARFTDVTHVGRRYDATLTYERALGFYGRIDVYVEKRALPEVQDQIAAVLAENEILNTTLKNHQADSDRLQDDLYMLGNQSVALHEESLDDVAIIENLKHAIEDDKQKMDEERSILAEINEAFVSLSQDRLSSCHMLLSHESKYDKIYKISNLVNFGDTSEVIANFTKAYPLESNIREQCHQYLESYSQASNTDQEDVELGACDAMYANAAWPLPGVGAVGGDCVLAPFQFPFAEGLLGSVNAIRAPMGYEPVEGAQMFGRFTPEVDVAAQFLLLSVLYTAFKWGYEAMKKCFHVSESSAIKVNMISGNQHGMFSHEENNANDETLNVMPLSMNA